MRVGFISRFDPLDATSLSGMATATWRALEACGLELVPLRTSPPPAPSHPAIAALRAAGRRVTTPRLRTTLRAQRRRLRDRLLPGRLEQQAPLALARSESAYVAGEIARWRPDALFGVCISAALYSLETPLPIVYCSDATARLINTTYPDYACRSEAYKRECDHLERVALGRVSAGIFSSAYTLTSAVEDYGLPAERAHVVPLGANVTAGETPLRPDPPRERRLELALVAADPERKRLDLCIDVVELLATRGWQAHLHFVGPPTRRASASPRVTCHGALRLSDPGDRARHQEVLRRSHFMLLPSLGEMYGIAPCEAAHFGRPSIVSAVGGLPTVVLDGLTGRVLPVAASAADYAEALIACSAPETYRGLSSAALARAHEVLSWEAWGVRTSEILERVTREGRAE